MYDVSNPFLRKISETQSKYKLVKKEITQQSSYNLSLELEEDLLRREAIIELEDRKNFYTLNKDVKLYLCPSVISLIGQEYNNDDNSLIFVHTKSSGGTEKFQIRRADNSDGKYAWFKAFYDSNIENSCIKIYYDETKKTLYFDVDYNIEILNEDSIEDKDIDIKHENNAINSFRNFYLRNLSELKKSEEGCIKLRNEFNEEYPVETLKTLTIEEYSLGTEHSKESFCYKIEYGKYRHAGPSIKGSNAKKHGIYMHDSEYTINGSVIPKEKTEETWHNFINQFTSFIEESGTTEEPLRASEKYDLLVNRMSAVLTKLLYLYYPQKYLNISQSFNLKLLLKWFGYDFDENMHAEELNFILNKNIRNDIPEVNENDPQYLGSALWAFLKKYSDEDSDVQDVDDTQEDYDDEIQIEEISDSTERLTGGDNIIYYGVPGTGKSFSIDEKISKLNEGNKIDLDDVLRVTFHPEYTYNDFIGQLVPTVIKEGENKGKYKYDFKEGPFTTALKRAYMHPTKNIYLILEEMSRGNCAAIFGDVFQLLDRDNEGKSRYFVDNEVVANEILTDSKNKNIILNIEELDSNKIRVPSNLYIWGTVNTSDQNVFVMDTAFKRRFEWKYVDTKPIEKKDESGHIIENEYLNDIDLPIIYDSEVEKISWIKFYQLLNIYISSSNYLGLGEDKQLGQFFINFYRNDEEFIKDKFNNKLLHYLWFDVQEKSYKEDKKLFNNDITCFSELYSFSQKNKKIFSDEFIKFINERL